MQISFKGTPVYFDTYGEGKAVMLLHGFLEERKIWDAFIPSLSSQFKVIRLDLFGHGETPGLGGIHTMELMAEAVCYLMDQLEVEKAACIGHSMGGYITMALADLYPERVDRLLLLDSSPKKDSAKRLEERNQVIRIVQKHKKVFVRSAVSNLFAEQSRAVFKEKLDQRIAAAMTMEVENIIATVKGMKLRKDREDILANFPKDKMIISGEDDALIPIDLIREVARRTETEFLALPGGHMSYIEQEKAVQKAIVNFLN